jgi:putative hydrolase of the HAD superfamily
MIGNSLKSDVLPVLAIGIQVVHIAFLTTWEHEKIDFTIEHGNFHAFEKLTDVLKIVK